LLHTETQEFNAEEKTQLLEGQLGKGGQQKQKRGVSEGKTSERNLTNRENGLSSTGKNACEGVKKKWNSTGGGESSRRSKNLTSGKGPLGGFWLRPIEIRTLVQKQSKRWLKRRPIVGENARTGGKRGGGKKKNEGIGAKQNRSWGGEKRKGGVMRHGKP